MENQNYMELLHGQAMQPQPGLHSQPGVEAQGVGGPNSYAAMMQQTPPEVAQLNVPAQSPAELEQRKAGWLQVLEQAMKNPNVTRALGHFGAVASAPRAPGQSSVNQFATAAMVGKTAYDFGEQAEYERQRTVSEDQRKAVESEARVENTRAQTTGLQTQNDITAATKDTVIAQAKVTHEKALQDLANAKTEAEKKKIELDWQKRLADVKRGITDPQILQSIEAELNKQGIENTLRRAQAGSAAATGRYYDAKAGEQETENEVLSTLTPEEKKQWITKTGKYASVKAATVQSGEYFEGVWEKANPKKPNEDDAAYQQRKSAAVQTYMTTAKEKPDSEEFLRWAQLFGKGDVTKDYADYLKWKGQAPEGKTPAGGATGVTVRKFDKDGNLIPR